MLLHSKLSPIQFHRKAFAVLVKRALALYVIPIKSNKTEVKGRSFGQRGFSPEWEPRLETTVPVVFLLFGQQMELLPKSCWATTNTVVAKTLLLNNWGLLGWDVPPPPPNTRTLQYSFKAPVPNVQMSTSYYSMIHLNSNPSHSNSNYHPNPS